MRELYFCTKCWRNHDYYSKIGQEHIKHAFVIPPELQEPMGKACMKYQIHLGDLIVKYVEHGLKRDGILEAEAE